MAAGLGFKDFATGEVLTAADVDGYLMQGVWVFASAAARDAAVTSPEEGNFAFLKDTNVTTYYTGSAWANLDTTGMTNPMTTTGDVIYSSSGSTPARLGIGTAGQVLQVNSGATAPEWATPASSAGLVKIGSTVTVSAASSATLNDVFSTTYDNYRVVATFSSSSASTDLLFRYRVSGSDNTTSNYYLQGQDVSSTATNSFRLTAQDKGRFGVSAGDETGFAVDIFSPFLSRKKRAQSTSNRGTIALPEIAFFWNTFNDTTSFTGLTIFPNSGTFSGEITVYGYAK
jgi:hypothetical protein